MTATLIRTGDLWVDTGAMTDRALQYGDGVFETIRLNSLGVAPLLERHRQRLLSGLQRLRFSDEAIATVAAAMNDLPAAPAGMTGLKILVSRGESARGYGAPDSIEPLIRLHWFVAPAFETQLLVCGINPVRLGRQPVLAGIKHLNRLEQVLARQSFAADWQESVMLDSSGLVTEGTMSNLFVKVDGRWLTPDLTYAGVSGIAREWLLEHSDSHVADITTAQLEQCSALIFCNSLTGIRAVGMLDGRSLAPAAEAVQWQSDYRALFA